MLESVGISAADEAAYRALLASPGCCLTDLAHRLGRSPDDLFATVERLEELGLLTRTSDEPARLLPTRPDVAVDALVAVRRAELDRVRAEARELLSELRAQEQYRPENLVEVIVGQDAIARQLALSSRTVGRRVAELMDTLGARTRFQAGIHAQRRGLLDPDS